MKQVRQHLRNGALDIGEVPVPAVGPNDVLVRTRYSFVSVGTEKMKVSQARMSLAAKAKQRPDQVRQVLDTVRDQGLVPTIRKVQERLKAPSTLGYSCSGVVEAVGAQVDDFRVGELVAAIGEGVATHAEYNAVPRNLVAKVPANVALEEASASAIGAIAIHSLRQAKLELGESVAIVGLGLLGQFLVQLCRASGCRVIGIDLDADKCELAMQSGAETACEPNTDEALHHALEMSGGLGMDAVLLTVSTEDLGPIHLAAALVRDRGRVVCVGNTAIQLDWRTWFGKEIDFQFSRAMGAGIYDPDYFYRDRDYPVGYVRWTANRNMQAFLDLLEQNKLDLSKLITHRVPFTDAKDVFDRIASGAMSKAVGIVFEYAEPEQGAVQSQLRTLTFSGEPPTGLVRLGQIGAGNYAKSMLMPHFPGLARMSLVGICTTKGVNSEDLARRYGFRKATTDAQALLRDPEVNAILVATRHDSHAPYAAAALRAGKHVYVEKPLALTDEQLGPVIEALAEREESGPTLWLGHNRRFSSLTRQVLAHFDGITVRQVACTVRATGVPADSWYQHPTEGGGVLFGDVCHFLDLCIWLQQSLPTDVSAFATPDPSHRAESWAITMRFMNGGLGVVHYVCGGQKGLDRETVDISGGSRSARIAGFRRLILDGSRRGGKQWLQPDMGQKSMLETMVAQFSRTAGARDYTESFLISAQALLAAQRSIAERRIVTIEPRFPFTID